MFFSVSAEIWEIIFPDTLLIAHHLFTAIWISHTRDDTRISPLIQSGAGIVGRHAYSILDVRELRGAAIARQTTLTAAAPTYRHQQRQPSTTGATGTAGIYEYAQSSSSSTSSIGTCKIGTNSLGSDQCPIVPIAEVIDMTVSAQCSSASSAASALSADLSVIDMTLPRAAQQDAATVNSTTNAAQTPKTTELVDLTVAATMRVGAASPRDAAAAADLFSDSGSLRLIRIRNPWVRRPKIIEFFVSFAMICVFFFLFENCSRECLSFWI